MLNVTLEQLQKDFPAYLRLVKTGETLVIMQGEEAIAQVTPVAAAPLEPRPFGLCAGQFAVPDDFDAPLPEETVAAFEGR